MNLIHRLPFSLFVVWLGLFIDGGIGQTVERMHIQRAKTRHCGTNVPSEDFLQSARSMSDIGSTNGNTSEQQLKPRQNSDVVIETYFHVVTAEPEQRPWYMAWSKPRDATEKQLSKQVGAAFFNP